MTTAHTQTGSESSERDPTVSIDSEPADAPAARTESSGMGAAYTVLPVLLIALPVVTLVLLIVVLPIRDGMRDGDRAEETYRNFQSATYSARWGIDSEFYEARASLDSDLYSLDSALWSVGLDLGSLAYDLGAESRPRVRSMEDEIDARRDEVDQLRRSADARFARLQDNVDARLGGLEDMADGAVDAHWDESGRRYSRNMRIATGALWGVVGVMFVVGMAALWVSWRNYRALAKQAGRM